MNKARKRRQRRKERDLRWVQSEKPYPSTLGSHRGKKIFGVEKIEGKNHQAFWCKDTDEMPLIARLFNERAGRAK